MKKLLNFLVVSILGKKAKVAIEEKKIDGVTVFNIEVQEGNAGQIIGKGGRTIKAVKALLAVRSKGQTPFALTVGAVEPAPSS